MLGALGLDPVEEAVYRRLVTDLCHTPTQLSAAVGEPVEVITATVDRLVARGLAVAAGSDPPTFQAAPPTVALGALLRRRRDDLHAAEEAIAALADEHRVASLDREGGPAFEIITDVGAVRHRFAQLHETARREVLSMVTPNLTVVPHRENAAGRATLVRGVRHRVIMDRRALDQPDMVSDVIESIECGQEIRVVDRLPTKMIIVDGGCAMLPLHSGGGSASILVQAAGVVAALIAFFEAVWDRAFPLRPDPTGDALAEDRPHLDELDSRILALLLTGMTEEAVAGQLRTSRRTVQRRIHKLMAKAGAETRIELGWYAARNSWA